MKFEQKIRKTEKTGSTYQLEIDTIWGPKALGKSRAHKRWRWLCYIDSLGALQREVGEQLLGVLM